MSSGMQESELTVDLSCKTLLDSSKLKQNRHEILYIFVCNEYRICEF